MVLGLGGPLGHSELPPSSVWRLQPHESFEAHSGPSMKGKRSELGIVRCSWMSMCMCLSVGQGTGMRLAVVLLREGLGCPEGDLCLGGVMDGPPVQDQHPSGRVIRTSEVLFLVSFPSWESVQSPFLPHTHLHKCPMLP